MKAALRRSLLLLLALAVVAALAWAFRADPVERVTAPVMPPVVVDVEPPSALPVSIDVPAPQLVLLPMPEISAAAVAYVGDRLPARRSVRVLETSALYRRQIELAAADVWGLSGSPARLAAQLHQESNFKVRARSPVGAQGLAQFMPATARWIAEQYPEQLGQFDPWDTSQAILAAAIYDKHLLDRSDADTECDRWAFALSKYNGGERHFGFEQRAAMRAGHNAGQWWGGVAEHRTRGERQWRENRGYVQRILVDLEPAYVDAGWVGPVACARSDA